MFKKFIKKLKDMFVAIVSSESSCNCGCKIEEIEKMTKEK